MQNKQRRLPIRKIRDDSGYFSKMIEVRLPVYFTWDIDGEFLGIDIPDFPEYKGYGFTPYCRRLLREAVSAVNGEEDTPKREVGCRASMPEVFKRAIKDIQNEH